MREYERQRDEEERQLADEALDKVAGGSMRKPCCFICHRDDIPLGMGSYRDPAYVRSISYICEDCLKANYGPEWTWRKL